MMRKTLLTATVSVAVAAAGCSKDPAPARPTPTAFGAPAGSVSVRAVIAALTAPAAPSGLTASAAGGTVMLTWNAPASGDPVATYIIEAGSSSETANLANFPTGTTATTFSAAGVGAGTYYVRVRAQNSAGTSAPSNEATLVVGSLACTSAPAAPTGLTQSVSGGTVTLAWTAGSGGCAATSYVLQAGSSSGASNLANAGTGSTATSYVATGVGNGTYYVRVLAQNAFGSSAASNEVVVIVGGTPTVASVDIQPRSVTLRSTTSATPPYPLSNCTGGVLQETFTISAPSNVTWSFPNIPSGGYPTTVSMTPQAGTGNGTATITVRREPSFLGSACREGSDVPLYASFDTRFTPCVAGTSIIFVEVKYYVR